MWNAETTKMSDTAHRVMLASATKTLSVADVIALWKDDTEFRLFFSETLVGSDFDAFRWETPALTEATLDQQFECVLLRADALSRKANPAAFSAQFEADKSVVTFANLGGDAIMIVPCPAGPESRYAHLAEFLRHAPRPQTDALWVSVAQAMTSRISAKPVWLSTAGMGVPWLHVRLDDRPKYYGHAPYRDS